MKKFVLLPLCLIVTLFLCGPRAFAQCSGSTSTAATGANAGTAGTAAWQNPNNIQSIDGSVTSVDAVVSGLSIITTTTDYLNVTNLGLSVPAANTICGVVVTINRRTFAFLTLGASTVSDNSIQLIKGGVRTGTEHAATGTAWPATMTAASYGSSGDMWGTTLTPSDVNAGNFGVAISSKLVAQVLSVAFTAQIDQVTVTVYSSGPIVLPITFRDFTAHAGKAGNVLEWSMEGALAPPSGSGAASAGATGVGATATINRFAIERSADGGHWQQLDIIPATAAQHNYTYTDAAPLAGTSLYRIAALNADGPLVWSEIRSVNAAGSAGGAGWTGGMAAGLAASTAGGPNISIYPNPFYNMINISSPRPFCRLLLKDLQGQTLWAKGYAAGVNTAQVPASNWPAGIYLLQVDGATFKIIKK